MPESNLPSLTDKQQIALDGLRELLALWEAHPEFIDVHGFNTIIVVGGGWGDKIDLDDALKLFIPCLRRIDPDKTVALRKSFGPHRLTAVWCGGACDSRKPMGTWEKVDE